MRRRSFLKNTLTLLMLSGSISLTAAGKLFAQVADQLKVWSVAEGDYIMTDKIIKSDREWREILTPEQYRVTRQHGTEPAFTGQYDKHYEPGVYQCICCGQDLFLAEHKYDSGTGWPSFYQPVAMENIGISVDRSWLMVRNEVHCSRCHAHLGHVFEDGPQPTGLRYCINSASLNFVES